LIGGHSFQQIAFTDASLRARQCLLEPRGERRMNSYKSVVKLYAAVQQANPRKPLELRRTGTRSFQLSIGSVAAEASGTVLQGGNAHEFVFGQGFVPAGRAPREVASRRFTLRSALGQRDLPAKSSVFAVAGAALALTLVIGFLAWPQAKPSRQPHFAVSSSFAPAVGTNHSCADALSQADSFVAGRAKFAVIADESRGGVRQLTFTDAWTNQPVQVRLFKKGNTWKAKSATPLGSHSLD
jgi:hypothetical protein